MDFLPKTSEMIKLNAAQNYKHTYYTSRWTLESSCVCTGLKPEEA